MDPQSIRPVNGSSNEPHNLLARLYREIGVSAVAAALQAPDVDAVGRHGAVDGRDTAVIAAEPADKAA